MLELIKKCCEENRDRLFFVSSAGSLTFGELWRKAATVAATLSEGRTPVIVRGHKEPYMPIAFLACLMAGRAYVPCDTAIPDRRLQHIITVCGTDTIIDREPDYGGAAINEPHNSSDDIAYIIFTSGSTGSPKGVRITKGNLLCFVRWLSCVKPLDGFEHVRVLNQAAYSFDLSVCDLYYSMCFGHTCYCLEATSATAFADITAEIARCNPDFAVMTPTFAKLAMCDMDFCRDNVSALKCIFFCGETLEKRTCEKLFRRFPGITLLNAYGPTECTCAVSAIAITEKELAMPYLPVGRAGETSVEIFTVDGELVLKGDALSPGYLSAESGGFSKEVYYTGDLGEITQDGLIFCKGRKDSQIKLNGYRIELSEVHNRLSSLHGVEACRVTAEKANDGSVKCIRAVAAGEGLDGKALIEELSAFLPEYMLPKEIQIVSNLKLTQNAKNAL